MIETYALLDTGLEVMLCHERLLKQLAVSGRKLNFTLSGMTGSTRVKSELVDIVVSSMDDKMSVELPNVTTVDQMPISKSCIAKKGDVHKWPHLRDLPLEELETGEVMLVIRLQDKSALFLPLEYRAAGEKDPVAIRYSLGWTVVGSVGGKKSRLSESSYFTRVLNNTDECLIGDGEYETKIQAKCIPPKLEELREFQTHEKRNYNDVYNIPSEEHLVTEQTDDLESTLSKEVEQERMNEDLKHQLERLWKTDFEGSLVETKVCPSLEDKKVPQIMEETLKVVDGHFLVTLPWRNNPPYLPNNKVVAERQGFLLKNSFSGMTTC